MSAHGRDATRAPRRGAPGGEGQARASSDAGPGRPRRLPRPRPPRGASVLPVARCARPSSAGVAGSAISAPPVERAKVEVEVAARRRRLRRCAPAGGRARGRAVLPRVGRGQARAVDGGRRRPSATQAPFHDGGGSATAPVERAHRLPARVCTCVPACGALAERARRGGGGRGGWGQCRVSRARAQRPEGTWACRAVPPAGDRRQLQFIANRHPLVAQVVSAAEKLEVVPARQ